MVVQFSFDVREPKEYHSEHYGMFTMICPTKCFEKQKLNKDTLLYRYSVLLESDSDCSLVIKKILNHYFGYQLKRRINRSELKDLIVKKETQTISWEEQNLFGVLIEKFNWEIEIYEKSQTSHSQGSF